VVVTIGGPVVGEKKGRTPVVGETDDSVVRGSTGAVVGGTTGNGVVVTGTVGVVHAASASPRIAAKADLITGNYLSEPSWAQGRTASEQEKSQNPGGIRPSLPQPDRRFLQRTWRT
jgi:hypothetical protein